MLYAICCHFGLGAITLLAKYRGASARMSGDLLCERENKHIRPWRLISANLQVISRSVTLLREHGESEDRVFTSADFVWWD